MKLFSESWNGMKADVGMDLQPFVQDLTAAEQLTNRRRAYVEKRIALGC